MRFSIPCLAPVLAGLLTACNGAPRAPSVPEPLAVEIAAVHPPGRAMVTGVGVVAWEREMLLSFRVPGILAHLTVDFGDPIRRGQVLAELDARDLTARLAQMQGDVARAERAVDRYAALSEDGAVARSRYEDESTVLAQARAAQGAAAFDRQSARLVSPVAGLVLERLAQTDETLAVGQGVLRVADQTSPLIVRVPIAADRIGAVRAGAPARIWISADTIIAGTVSRVARQINQRTGAADVEVRLSSISGMTSGMTVNVEIDTPAVAGESGIVAVPAEAVLEARNGSARLFLLDRKNARARRLSVRFIGFAGEDALIRGLPLGTAVITGGAGFLTDGQRVRVATAFAR